MTANELLTAANARVAARVAAGMTPDEARADLARSLRAEMARQAEFEAFLATL